MHARVAGKRGAAEVLQLERQTAALVGPYPFGLYAPCVGGNRALHSLEQRGAGRF
jgi:hypothetical protein